MSIVIMSNEIFHLIKQDNLIIKKQHKKNLIPFNKFNQRERERASNNKLKLKKDLFINSHHP